MLTIAQVCDLLGRRRSTVYTWMNDHGLPYRVPPGGGDRRVPESELAAWLDTWPGPRARRLRAV